MTAWTSDELNKIGKAEELRIASLRSDGTLRKPVTSGSSALATISMSDPLTGAPPPGSAAFRRVMKDTSKQAAWRKMSPLWRYPSLKSMTRSMQPIAPSIIVTAQGLSILSSLLKREPQPSNSCLVKWVRIYWSKDCNGWY